MARHPIARVLTRLRYRAERYFFLLLVVVVPVLAIAALVGVAYLAMTRDLTVASLATSFTLPAPVARIWAQLDPYLSREAEIIIVGIVILTFLVMVAYIADRRYEL